MKIIAKNKKASFEYSFKEKYTSGIQLYGSEVKSIRNGDVSLTEAHCYFIADELFVRGMHIAEFKQASYSNHEPLRERKLLLNRKELDSLRRSLEIKGLTIIPITLFETDKGIFKLEIALSIGKKNHDKREAIKSRDIERELKRID